jgi:pSer/pThr/pTyr-binding forkhead associated (FHA) protein
MDDNECDTLPERMRLLAPYAPRLCIYVDGLGPTHVKFARYLIGRGKHCDLSLRGVGIGREHAVLVHTPDGWELQDLGADLGTFAAGEPVERKLLRSGDAVRIGRYEVTFQISAVAAVA